MLEPATAEAGGVPRPFYFWARSAIRACTSGRRSGGTVFGGRRRAGNSSRSRATIAAISPVARSTGSRVPSPTLVTPVTFRTNCSAAAVISSSVAAGSSPRRVVMFRHMSSTVRA
jgi:hypothetical protein